MSSAATLHRVMSTPAVVLRADASLAEAAEIMLAEGIGSVLCVDAADRLVGILTDSDFASKAVGIPFSTFRAPQLLGRWLEPGGVERIYQEARTRTVSEIMSKPVHTVGVDDSVEDVLDLMFERRIKHVPVVADGLPVGMVARHDLLKLLRDRLHG